MLIHRKAHVSINSNGTFHSYGWIEPHLFIIQKNESHWRRNISIWRSFRWCHNKSHKIWTELPLARRCCCCWLMHWNVQCECQNNTFTMTCSNFANKSAVFDMSTSIIWYSPFTQRLVHILQFWIAAKWMDRKLNEGLPKHSIDFFEFLIATPSSLSFRKW